MSRIHSELEFVESQGSKSDRQREAVSDAGGLASQESATPGAGLLPGVASASLGDES